MRRLMAMYLVAWLAVMVLATDPVMDQFKTWKW